MVASRETWQFQHGYKYLNLIDQRVEKERLALLQEKKSNLISDSCLCVLFLSQVAGSCQSIILFWLEKYLPMIED